MSTSSLSLSLWQFDWIFVWRHTLSNQFLMVVENSICVAKYRIPLVYSLNETILQIKLQQIKSIISHISQPNTYTFLGQGKSRCWNNNNKKKKTLLKFFVLPIDWLFVWNVSYYPSVSNICCFELPIILISQNLHSLSWILQ